MNRWPEAAAHVPESSLEHATAVIDALAGAGAIATTGAQVERLCPAIAPLIRLRYLDGAVRMGGLDQLAAAARDAEDVRHFISELVLDPPASSADLAGRRTLTRTSWYLAPSTRLRSWSGMLSTGRTAASNSGHPDPSQPLRS